MKYKLKGVKLKQLQGRSLFDVIITSRNPNNTISNHNDSSQKKNQSPPENKGK